MKKWWILLLLGLTLGLASACGSDDDDDDVANDDDDTMANDDDTEPQTCEIDSCLEFQELVKPDSPDCECLDIEGEWFKLEPEGKVCGNGSQYKFFVNFDNSSDNVAFIFEPGGACWDYLSCTGASGIRGAANPNGIPDDHMALMGLMHPYTNRLIKGTEWELPTHSWNYIFVPYCTGDVHTGATVMEYTNPDDPNDTITFHHTGHENVQAIIEWARERFPGMKKMLSTGCSAGGAGSIANYYFIREGIPQLEMGYMLNDSGPIFPDSVWSRPLHDKILESWEVDKILETVPEFDMSDFGSINRYLAEEYPQDRLAITYFRRDLNYSLYSYERFWDLDWHVLEEKGEILSHWWDDTMNLMEMYDQYDNLAYYIPYWRKLNSSHCAAIASYDGTEIQEEGVNLLDFERILFNDEVPLESYLESPQLEEDPPSLDYEY